MSKNNWADIGKLFDPPKAQDGATATQDEPKPDQPKAQKKQKAEKAIRRKHGKNSKI
jgi:hypothetical protein